MGLTNNRKYFDFQVGQQMDGTGGVAVRQKRHKITFLTTAEDMDPPEVVGNRLFKVRFVLGYGARKQKEFAEAMGFEYDSYNNWEGTKPIMIPVYAAIAICERTGNNVTLDYIYRGRLEGVGPKWAEPLEDAPDRPDFAPNSLRLRPPPPRRSRRD